MQYAVIISTDKESLIILENQIFISCIFPKQIITAKHISDGGMCRDYRIYQQIRILRRHCMIWAD